MLESQGVLKEEDYFWAERGVALAKTNERDDMNESRARLCENLGAVVELTGCVAPEIVGAMELAQCQDANICQCIVSHSVIPFLVSLVENDVQEVLLRRVLCALEVISACADEDVVRVLLQSGVTARLQSVFAYASREAAEIHRVIAAICWNITRGLVNSDELNMMNECFFQQATMWAVGSLSCECREYCLIFLYHVVVETEPPRIDQLETIFEVAITSIVPDGDGVVSLACTILRRLLATGEFFSAEIAPEIFERTWTMMESPSMVKCLEPCLKLQIEVIRGATEVTPSLIDIVQWDVLVDMMVQSDAKIQYLACGVMKQLVNGGVNFIERLFRTKFMEAAYSVYKNSSAYKGQLYLTECLQNILLGGSGEQQLVVIIHPVFAWMLDFLVSADESVVRECLQAVQFALDGKICEEIRSRFREFQVEKFIGELARVCEDGELAETVAHLLDLMQ